jgi:hypothetical protein
VPEEVLITEVEGPRGTAEIFEVTLGDVTKADHVLEVEYAVVFANERTGVPSLGEAHLLANQLTGLDADN